MKLKYRRALLFISLESAKSNFLTVKNSLKKGVKICCVVKADAYGHGAVKLSKLFESLGAHFFATATYKEAVLLRKSGITKPILILGYTPPFLAKKLEKYNLSQTVHSAVYASALYKSAKNQGAKVKVHLKIDTGFNRIGFSCVDKSTSELESAVLALKNDAFILEGVYTHFACSDNFSIGKNYTHFQYKNFLFAIKYLKKRGLNFSIKHCGNSATVFNYPQFCMDMVRVGIVLYGIAPSKFMQNFPKLYRVMTLKTIVESVKNVKKGQNIGYGLEVFAPCDMQIATLPVGYADGLLRSTYKTNYRVLINGKYCSFIGRICMDKCTVCVSGLNVKPFDEVVIFGEDDKANVENLAVKNGTIPYELLTQISKRVDRIYK